MSFKGDIYKNPIKSREPANQGERQFFRDLEAGEVCNPGSKDADD